MSSEPGSLYIPGKETKHHGARQFEGGAGPVDHRTRASRPFGQMGENSFSALGDRYCGGLRSGRSEILRFLSTTFRSINTMFLVLIDRTPAKTGHVQSGL